MGIVEILVIVAVVVLLVLAVRWSCVRSRDRERRLRLSLFLLAFCRTRQGCFLRYSCSLFGRELFGAGFASPRAAFPEKAVASDFAVDSSGVQHVEVRPVVQQEARQGQRQRGVGQGPPDVRHEHQDRYRRRGARRCSNPGAPVPADPRWPPLCGTPCPARQPVSCCLSGR